MRVPTALQRYLLMYHPSYFKILNKRKKIRQSQMEAIPVIFAKRMHAPGHTPQNTVSRNGDWVVLNHGHFLQKVILGDRWPLLGLWL